MFNHCSIFNNYFNMVSNGIVYILLIINIIILINIMMNIVIVQCAEHRHCYTFEKP